MLLSGIGRDSAAFLVLTRSGLRPETPLFQYESSILDYPRNELDLTVVIHLLTNHLIKPRYFVLHNIVGLDSIP